MSSSGFSLRKSFRNSARNEATARRRRLFLETLEQRQLLAVVEYLPGQSDSYSLDEDTPLSESVLSNDNSGATSAQVLNGPVNGSLVFPGDGSFTYTPNPDFFGTDTFYYQATDGTLSSQSIEVALNVAAVNDAPVAANDSFSLDENSTLTVSNPHLLSNDTDVDGDALTAVLVSGPTNGTLSLSGDGTFTYTPTSGHSGSDSFVYKVNDGAADSNDATVSLTINDVSTPPVANVEWYPISEDSVLSVSAPGVLGNDLGESLSATLLYGPGNGSVTMNADGSFEYTPVANFFGYDSFTYQLAENVTATVSIEVTSVNDAPSGLSNQTYGGLEDQQIVVSGGLLAGVTDVDTDLWNLWPTLITWPQHGSVQFEGYGSFVYTPNQNYHGEDTFTYKVHDGQLDSAESATVTLIIAAVNDDPIGVPDAFTFQEDNQCSVGNVQTNDDATDGPVLHTMLTTPPQNGTVELQLNGNFHYIPNPNFVGTDSFWYHYTDSVGSEFGPVLVSLTIEEVNDAPVAANDSYSGSEDQPLFVYSPGLLENDTDIDSWVGNHQLLIVTPPSNGSVSMNSYGAFTYTPATNFFGTDTFTYRLDDNGITSEEATVTIEVTPVNDAPEANDRWFTFDEDTVLATTEDDGLKLGTSDVENDTLTFAILDQPQNGTLTVNASTGSFEYTPNVNFYGTDGFTYTVSDNQDLDLASVTLTVSPVNDPPAAIADSYTLDEDTTLTVPAYEGVLSNDSDIEGDSLTASIVTGPAHGTVTLNADGSFEYVPVANFSGPDSFYYQLSDGSAASSDVIVSLEVAPEPFVRIIGNSALEGESVSITFVLSRLTDRDVTITYSTVDGTAIANNDYLPATTGIAVIPAGSLTTTAIIATESDTENEENEAFLVEMTETINANPVPSGNAVVTIIDAPGYSLSISVSDGIEGGYIEAIISRSGDLSESAVVNFQVVDGSAIHGEDFLALEGQVALSAGVSSSDPIEILLLTDDLWEPTETLEIKAWVLGSEASATAEIADDDSLPELAVTDPVGVEPATGATDYLDFYVSYATAGQSSLTVEVLLGDGIPGDPEHAAEVGQDVGPDILVFTDPASTTPIAVISSGDSWTFSSNEAPTIFRVSVLQDSLAETDEFVHLELRPGITDALSPASKLLGIGTILTSLATPANTTGITASIEADTDEVEEGGTAATFTITLENAPEYHSGGSLRVTYDVTGTATEGRDFTRTRHYASFAILSPANWDSTLGKYRMTTQHTFEVFAFADSVPEADIEEFTITLVEVRASGIDGVANGSYPIADQSQAVGIVDKNLAFSMVVSNTDVVEPGPTPNPAVATSFDLTITRIMGNGAATFDIAVGGSASFMGLIPDFGAAPGTTLIFRPRQNIAEGYDLPAIDGPYFTVHIPHNVPSVTIAFEVKVDNIVEDPFETITFTAVPRTLLQRFSVRPASVAVSVADDGTDSLLGGFAQLYTAMNNRLTNWKSDSKIAIGNLREATKDAIALVRTEVGNQIAGGVEQNTTVADLAAGVIDLYLISRGPGYSLAKEMSLKAAGIATQIMAANLTGSYYGGTTVNYNAAIAYADIKAGDAERFVDDTHRPLDERLQHIKANFDAALTTSDSADDIHWYDQLQALKPEVDALQDGLLLSGGVYPSTNKIAAAMILRIAGNQGCSVYRNSNGVWTSDDWFLTGAMTDWNGRDYMAIMQRIDP